MVATVTSNLKRKPLLPSEPENGGNYHRPKAREVTSRYLSSSSSNSSLSSSSNTTATWSSSSTTTRSLLVISSKRYQSPAVSRVSSTMPQNTESAASVGRRRAVAVDATPSNAEKMLVKSMRSLSVSFQDESFPLPVSKAKTAAGGGGTAGAGLRKGTIVRENSRPSDQQQRWPGRSRGDNSNFVSQSFNCGADGTKLGRSGTVKNELRKSITDENSRYKFDDKLTNKLVTGLNPAILVASDTESVSSESVESGSAAHLRGGKRGITVPARFWQELNRSQKLPDLTSPSSTVSGLSRKADPSKLIGAKKFLNEKNAMSSPRGLSPLRAGTRPASPGKFATLNSIPSKGMDSPRRIRNGAGTVLIDDDNNNAGSMLSMISFVTDARREKLGEIRIVDAYDLRLLYNRQLQWRFVNARAEKVLLAHKEMAERSQFSAWISITRLRHSVMCKRIELRLLRLNMKLYSILQGQEPYLEHWDLINVDHSNALSGAKDALEASTIRLPFVGGARANVQNLEEAISSAVDVMQGMASSICSLLTKVEQMNLMVSELANLSAREHSLLDECKDFLSSKLIPLQVMHCSLRTELLQLQNAYTSLSRKV